MLMLRQLLFELTTTVPPGINTPVVAVGTIPQLQLPGFSHAVFIGPVQVLVVQAVV